jgi:hypothetical protein
MYSTVVGVACVRTPVLYSHRPTFSNPSSPLPGGLSMPSYRQNNEAITFMQCHSLTCQQEEESVLWATHSYILLHRT